MACWVAPAIAAELWGLDLNHVLGAVADGSIPSSSFLRPSNGADVGARI